MKDKFDLYDYLIFFLVLFVSIFIGLFFGLNLSAKLKSLINKLKSRKNKTIPVQDEIELKSSDQKDEADETMKFLTANSTMGALPVALSLLATFFSSCNKNRINFTFKAKFICFNSV
jgi:hypothetical protein